MSKFEVTVKILVDAAECSNAIVQVLTQHERIALVSYREVDAAEDLNMFSTPEEIADPAVKTIDDSVTTLVRALGTMRMYCWITLWNDRSQPKSDRALKLVEALPGKVYHNVDVYDGANGAYEIASAQASRKADADVMASVIKAQWRYPVVVDGDAPTPSE